MSVKITSNFKVLYDDVKEGISISLQSLRAKNPRIDDSINAIRGLIVDVFSEAYDDKGAQRIADVLSRISIMAYFQEFDNDKNFDKLQKYYSIKDTIKDKDGNETEVTRKFANIELDFKFGFSELLDLLFEKRGGE